MRLIYENNHEPALGRYKNVFVEDQTNDSIFVYDSEGIYTLLAAKGPQMLSIVDNVLSISGGNQITLPDGLTDIDNFVLKTRTVNGHPLSSNVVVTKADVSLSNVDNTSDASKPVSTAQAAALALKMPLVATPIAGRLALVQGDGSVANSSIAAADLLTRLDDIEANSANTAYVNNRAQVDWNKHLHTIYSNGILAGSWSINSGQGWNEASWLQSIGTVLGDSIKFRMYLEPGSYIITSGHRGGPMMGIQKFQLMYGLTEVFTNTLDQYLSGNTQIAIGTMPITITDAGQYDFVYTVTGKNASSSGYGGSVMYINARKQP